MKKKDLLCGKKLGRNAFSQMNFKDLQEEQDEQQDYYDEEDLEFERNIMVHHEDKREHLCLNKQRSAFENFQDHYNTTLDLRKKKMSEMMNTKYD